MTDLRKKLAILLWAATPERPELCASPFYYAAVAAALDCEVEVHFSGTATRLLIADVAQQLYPPHDSSKSIYSFMREASDLGVRFLGCAVALRTNVGGSERLIPEYSGTASATDFILRTLDPSWSTLVF
jgi:predicted peroxiredoxin